MKYKVLQSFLPGVIVGQECEIRNGYIHIYFETSSKYLQITNCMVELSYAKKHPEIFEPIEELKENETEFKDVGNPAGLVECKMCHDVVLVGKFCSNCGRKRVDK